MLVLLVILFTVKLDTQINIFTSKVTMWKSEGLSNESIKSPSMSDNSPGINYFDNARI